MEIYIYVYFYYTVYHFHATAISLYGKKQPASNLAITCMLSVYMWPGKKKKKKDAAISVLVTMVRNKY